MTSYQQHNKLLYATQSKWLNQAANSQVEQKRDDLMGLASLVGCLYLQFRERKGKMPDVNVNVGLSPSQVSSKLGYLDVPEETLEEQLHIIEKQTDITYSLEGKFKHTEKSSNVKKTKESERYKEKCKKLYEGQGKWLIEAANSKAYAQRGRFMRLAFMAGIFYRHLKKGNVKVSDANAFVSLSYSELKSKLGYLDASDSTLESNLRTIEHETGLHFCLDEKPIRSNKRFHTQKRTKEKKISLSDSDAKKLLDRAATDLTRYIAVLSMQLKRAETFSGTPTIPPIVHPGHYSGPYSESKLVYKKSARSLERRKEVAGILLSSLVTRKSQIKNGRLRVITPTLEEIAERQGISPYTEKEYLKRIAQYIGIGIDFPDARIKIK